MVQIRTIDEANEVLAGYVPKMNELLGKDITLERIRPLMELLGDPQNNLRIVHIAGTSGKSSTAYYVAGLLQQAGQKVGLTISPHMDSVTERVQIGLQPLEAAEFCHSLTEFLEIIESFEPKPSYFELVIAYVFWYFSENKTDYAVIETGMGGLHDATNVAERADKVCLITDIGYDHMHVLGNTLTEIAVQKAGIIHPGNQAFMFDQGDEINSVIDKYARQQGAKLTILDTETERQKLKKAKLLQPLPLYQQRNWLLAFSAYKFMVQRDGLPELSQEDLSRSAAVHVPGRMDITNIKDKTVIMDGAHNEPKMKAFVQSFQKKFPNQKAAVLLSLKEGKEFQNVLPLLQPITSKLILTTFRVNQDLPTAPIDPKILAYAAQEAGIPSIQVELDPTAAYQKLLQTTENIKIVTGSFYLLSQIRQIIT